MQPKTVAYAELPVDMGYRASLSSSNADYLISRIGCPLKLVMVANAGSSVGVKEMPKTITLC